MPIAGASPCCRHRVAFKPAKPIRALERSFLRFADPYAVLLANWSMAGYLNRGWHADRGLSARRR